MRGLDVLEEEEEQAGRKGIPIASRKDVWLGLLDMKSSSSHKKLGLRSQQ